MAKTYIEKNGGIGELVRKAEHDYTKGNVSISEYVVFDMYETINVIEAYLNSKHTSGEHDSLGREKPFFNIVVAASNIWYRATDLDRKQIRVKATKGKSIIDAFLATVHLQDWMTREKFGQFLNEWGRVLARYGSAVVKFIEKDGKLIPSVIPWNRLICDAIDFNASARIEVIELTEGQLKKRKGYRKDVVEALCAARTARETLKKKRKDTKNDYIRIYEVHDEQPLSWVTGNPADTEYVQQMQVMTFMEGDKKNEHDDYILYAGREEKDPYMITHLIKEDGRTLAMGAVEHLFQNQWMVNHSIKNVKDQLDLASKLIFQTADETFVGQNALSAIETGDILVHAVNMPLTQIANTSHDTESLRAFLAEWKSLGNEIVGISDAMLGAQPKSGTAWRQTEALLQENYSLFEQRTENKALHLEDMLREFILPFIKRTKLNNAKEISATLKSYDIDWIDAKYLKNYSIKESNRIIKEKMLKGERVTPTMQKEMMASFQKQAKSALSDLGNQRFFKPSDVTTKTWKKQFENMEWELEIDITGEAKDYQSMLATLNTALQVVMQPGFGENKQAQLVVDKILQATGQLSPLELSSVRSSSSPAGGSGEEEEPEVMPKGVKKAAVV